MGIYNITTQQNRRAHTRISYICCMQGARPAWPRQRGRRGRAFRPRPSRAVIGRWQCRRECAGWKHKRVSDSAGWRWVCRVTLGVHIRVTPCVSLKLGEAERMGYPVFRRGGSRGGNGWRVYGGRVLCKSRGIGGVLKGVVLCVVLGVIVYCLIALLYPVHIQS